MNSIFLTEEIGIFKYFVFENVFEKILELLHWNFE